MRWPGTSSITRHSGARRYAVGSSAPLAHVRFAQDMRARWTPANRVQTRRPRARPDSLADLVTYLCIARRARPVVSVSGDCLLFDGGVDHGVAVVAPP